MRRLLTLCLTVLLATQAIAEDMSFFSDPSLLEPLDGDPRQDQGYIAPGAEESIGKYRAIMVDQPEIHIAPDSKYRGAKPDDLVAMAEVFRSALSERFSKAGLQVVDQPGEGVLYFRWAISNVYLAKQKRRLLAYTPVGALVKAGTDAMKDVWDKVNVVEISVDAELLDSVSGDLLAASMVQEGQRKDKEAALKEDLATPEEIRSIVYTYADRVTCRITNTRKPAEERRTCRLVVASGDEEAD